MNPLNTLNTVQLNATTTTEGALLLLSGAGTGKTKVLTSRIIYILQQQLAKPSEILAVTFTNKAAKEIHHRIMQATLTPTNNLWIGTFHGMGLRILRRHYDAAKLKENFTILDTDDCAKIVKEILLNNNVSTEIHPPKLIANEIAKLKDNNINYNEIPPQKNINIGNTLTLEKVYSKYQERLKELNCVDFGDLIFLCIQIFKEYPEILNLWQTKFRYILVDEYQDTNIVQYLFVKVLSAKYGNIFCVGDDDQSIYSWRGAQVEHILRFKQSFANAQVMFMEQNYRSESFILKLASSLINHNKSRYKKTVFSDKETNNKAIVKESLSNKEEVDWIAGEIQKLINTGLQFQDIAILIRSSYLTRAFEDKFIKNNIPYKIVGGVKFYEREEIKDIIGYLRLLEQPYDDLAFLNIINTPRRGIGDSNLNQIKQYAKDNNLSLFLASKELANEVLNSNTVSKKVKDSLWQFVNLFNNLVFFKERLSLGQLVMRIVEDIKYEDYLEHKQKDKQKDKSQDKMANIQELANNIEEYNSVKEFLENIVLDNNPETDDDNNKVSLMTLHAAKGLEFTAVFLPGFEDEIIPNQRSIAEIGIKGLEEERRLAYVGITRAKHNLFISYCTNRNTYGNSYVIATPSRFLEEMDQDYLQYVKNSYNFFKEQDANIKNFDHYFDNNNYANNMVNYISKTINKNSIVYHKHHGRGVVTQINGTIATVVFDNDNSTHSMHIDFLEIDYL